MLILDVRFIVQEREQDDLALVLMTHAKTLYGDRKIHHNQKEKVTSKYCILHLRIKKIQKKVGARILSSFIDTINFISG